MDAFSYLSVLISIILGLAITQILQGFRGLMLARSRVRVYWPSVLWAFTLLLICVQAWWVLYLSRLRSDWSFLDFAMILAQTIPLYLAAGLVFPDIGTEDVVDLRTHYFNNHRWFFTLLALGILISIGKVLVLIGAFPAREIPFEAFFIAACIGGAVLAREWYHKLIAPLALLSFGLYIALLFEQLR